MAINTHQGTNIEGGWIIYRNSINAFRTVLSGLDTSALVFSLEFYTPGGTTAKLTLTEASGAITNDDAGTIDYSLSVANLATLPRDRYFFVIKYKSGDDTYPLAQGFTNITSETNPGTTLTSVTIPVNVNSTQINMTVSLPVGSISNYWKTDGSFEITSDIVVTGEKSFSLGDGFFDPTLFESYATIQRHTGYTSYRISGFNTSLQFNSGGGTFTTSSASGLRYDSNPASPVSTTMISQGIADARYVRTTIGTAPANASATGTAGQVVLTSDYIYVCVATNTWKRVAISTW